MVRKVLLNGVALIASGANAAAQGLNLSQQCTATLVSVTSNPDVIQCLTPAPLLSIFASDNGSIIGPINNWLLSLCAAPPCRNSTLAQIVTNVTRGCPTEASAFGLQADDTQAAINFAQQLYPTLRQVMCLKDGSTNCVTQTLTNFQSVVGPLTISNVAQIVRGQVSPTNLPANVTCTNCVKASYNIVQEVTPSAAESKALKQQCGDSFIDGKMPDGIKQSASTSNGGGTSSKLKSSSPRMPTFNFALFIFTFLTTTCVRASFV